MVKGASFAGRVGHAPCSAREEREWTLRTRVRWAAGGRTLLPLPVRGLMPASNDFARSTGRAFTLLQLNVRHLASLGGAAEAGGTWTLGLVSSSEALWERSHTSERVWLSPSRAPPFRSSAVKLSGSLRPSKRFLNASTSPLPDTSASSAMSCARKYDHDVRGRHEQHLMGI